MNDLLSVLSIIIIFLSLEYFKMGNFIRFNLSLQVKMKSSCNYLYVKLSLMKF